MDLCSVPHAFKNGIGTFEAFRRLGFTPDEIQWHMNPDGMFFCVLVTQGKQFAVQVGYVKELAGKDWQSAFREVTTAINERRVPEETLREWYMGCEAFQRPTDFLLALFSKGIEHPKFLEDELARS